MVTVHRSAFLEKAIPRALIAVVAIAALIPMLISATGSRGDARSLGGDFPAFYTAGQMVVDGRFDDLYDPDVQRMYQEDFDDGGEGFLFFAYPPITALAYAPFGALPYELAFAVQSLVALAALIGAVALAWPGTGRDRPTLDTVLLVSAVALSTMPIVTSVLGGQNTTVTLLLAALVWWGCTRDRWIVAGAAAAAMLYKPQYGLIVIAILVVATQWRAVAVAIGGALAIFGVSAVWFGVRWPTMWLDQIRWFSAENQEVNGHLQVTISGWMRASLGASAAVTAVIVITTVVVIAAAIAVLMRTEISWWSFGVACGAMLLLAPSALAYDTGIALVAASVFGALVGNRPWLVAAVVVVTWSQVFARELGWSPLFLLLAGLFAVQVTALIGRPEIVSQAPGTIAAPAES